MTGDSLKTERNINKRINLFYPLPVNRFFPFPFSPFHFPFSPPHPFFARNALGDMPVCFLKNARRKTGPESGTSRQSP